MKDTKLTIPFALLAITLVLFVGVPIANIYGVQLIKDFEGLVRAATDPVVYHSIWLSVYSSALAALLAFLFGTPLAYILARKEFPGKNLVARVVDLPMVIPHIAAGIMLYGIFNRSGMVGGLVDEFLLFEDAVPGIVVAMLFVSLPFFVNSAREGFESVDPRLEHVSRTLGETPWRTFYKVSFPLASSHLLTGAVLSWARGISEFAAVAIIAYYPKTAPVLIRDRFTAYGLTSSRPATILLVTICLVTFILLWSLVKKMNRTGVKIENLHQDLGDFQLLDISLEVKEGEYFMVLGPTGAGKTILLETIAGIYTPDKGKLFIAGKNVKRIPPENRNIGFVYQDYVLFPHMTVMENVLYGLRARDLDEPEIKADKVIDLLELDNLRDRYPRTLSGGESQKVAVARAIAYQPKLLLLDEPTAALDPRTKEMVRSELENIHDKLEVTTIHVTHDQAEAKILGDRIAVLMGGRLNQVGTVEEVFNRPVSESVADFVGVENIIDGEVIDHDGEVALVGTGDFKIRVVSDVATGPVKVYLRPEDIFISEGPTESSARNSLPGRVLSVTQLGNVYRVRADNGLSCFVTKLSVEEFDLEPGNQIFTCFKATAASIRQTIAYGRN